MLSGVFGTGGVRSVDVILTRTSVGDRVGIGRVPRVTGFPTSVTKSAF